MIYPVAYQRMMKWSNKEDADRGMPGIWQGNTTKNLEYFDAHPEKVIGSIHDIPKHEGKAVVFVGRGQSLEKAIDMFAGMDDRFIIVCTNSSIRYLLDHGIVPHYMMLIDGEAGNWTFDGLPESAKDVTAIFAPGAYHEEVVKWPGKIMVVPYGIKHGKLQKEIRKRWGKSIPAGGNALNGGVAIFLMNTLAKIYVFVGNNLSFKEGERFYFNQDTDRDDKAYWVMHDIYGEECYTDIPMYEYKIWLEQAASQFWPECYFVNCSEGILGVDIDDTILPLFDHMPLDLAVERIKEALDFENQSTIDRYKGFYQMLYDRDMYEPHNGRSVWKNVQYNIESAGMRRFKKALDVGCGLAEGIREMRDAGYNVYGVDIADVSRKWKEIGVDGVCRQAPAHEIPYPDATFDFVYCGDVLEHIPEEYIEATLREMYRVGSRDFLFIIAVGLENLPVHEGIYTHVSLKSQGEWNAVLEKVGYKIRISRLDGEHLEIQATKGGNH